MSQASTGRRILASCRRHGGNGGAVELGEPSARRLCTQRVTRAGSVVGYEVLTFPRTHGRTLDGRRSSRGWLLTPSTSCATSSSACSVRRRAAASCSRPAPSTPPTSSSHSSVVVASSTPAMKPPAMSASIERPPVPGHVKRQHLVAERRPAPPRACVTHGVVTPNIEAATSGRALPQLERRGLHHPRHGRSRVREDARRHGVDARHIDDRGRQHHVAARPRSGACRPPAIVETISFGHADRQCPHGLGGDRRVARAPAPRARRRSAPRRTARVTTAVAPRAIASTAWPRSPAARSAPTSPLAARGDLLAAHVGLDQGWPMMPASTRIVPTPAARSRSRRNAYSRPFVSSVPTSTTVFAATSSSSRVSGATVHDCPCRR